MPVFDRRRYDDACGIFKYTSPFSKTCRRRPAGNTGGGVMISRAIANLCCATAMLAGGALAAQATPFMIVGNDEKLIWDDAGKVVLSPAGKDSALIVDLADPLNPTIVANIPLKNS